MDYELALQLKKAGYPQESDDELDVFYSWGGELNDLGEKMIEIWQLKFLKGLERATAHGKELVFAPDLRHLIRTCGDDFGQLIAVKESKKFKLATVGWVAHKAASPMTEEMYSTPEEACARLWLELNPGRCIGAEA